VRQELEKNMSENNKPIRLHKYIADCGVTSRRKAEGLILEARVSVNGETVTTLGTKINPTVDAVSVDGTYIDKSARSEIYLIMNKPRGVICSRHDPEGRRTVVDLCSDITERVYPVGRLDYYSEGLLLLTNDGDVAQRIIHPRHNIIKSYEVKIFGAINTDILHKLRAGLHSNGDFLKPLSVRVIKQLPKKTWIEFQLSEGKNREIRRLCEGLGLTIDKLKRVSIGGLAVDGIAPGKYISVPKSKLLSLIGTGKDGELDPNAKYLSGKKTIKSKKIDRGHFQEGPLANDETFNKFRKETYVDAAKSLQERKRLENEKKKTAPEVINPLEEELDDAFFAPREDASNNKSDEMVLPELDF
jgi:23S rRNA pseudouridine2605 synthase